MFFTKITLLKILCTFIFSTLYFLSLDKLLSLHQCLCCGTTILWKPFILLKTKWGSRFFELELKVYYSASIRLLQNWILGLSNVFKKKTFQWSHNRKNQFVQTWDVRICKSVNRLKIVMFRIAGGVEVIGFLPSKHKPELGPGHCIVKETSTGDPWTTRGPGAPNPAQLKISLSLLTPQHVTADSLLLNEAIPITRIDRLTHCVCYVNYILHCYKKVT